MEILNDRHITMLKKFGVINGSRVKPLWIVQETGETKSKVRLHFTDEKKLVNVRCQSRFIVEINKLHNKLYKYERYERYIV